MVTVCALQEVAGRAGVDLAGAEAADQAGQPVAADPGGCSLCSLLPSSQACAFIGIPLI